MSNFIDKTGQRYGKLVVLKRADNDATGHTRWLCQCDCGTTKIISSNSLYNGTKSCGCLQREVAIASNTIHGYSGKYCQNGKIRNVWRGIIYRCEKPNSIEYHNYGARGIKVCPEWHDLKTFGDWAIANGWQEGLQIDRIDNNGNYEPSNCRFVTKSQNARNKRNTSYVDIGGERIKLVEAAEKYGVSRYTIRNRLRAGYKGFDLVSKDNFSLTRKGVKQWHTDY